MTFQILWEIYTGHISPGGVISYISYRLVTPQRLRFFSESRYKFGHYSLKSSRVFKRTARAYKRTKNGMFSSGIASPFKETEHHTPTDNSEDCPPPSPRVRSRPILISRLLRMRVLTSKKSPCVSLLIGNKTMQKLY